MNLAAASYTPSGLLCAAGLVVFGVAIGMAVIGNRLPVSKTSFHNALAMVVGLASLCMLTTACASSDGGVVLPSPFFLGAAPVHFVLDPLARWFLAIIGFVSLMVVWFSPGYLASHGDQCEGYPFWPALAVLIASMCMVVLAGNAITFLVAWEVMALSSFVLVGVDHHQRTVRQAAIIYLGSTRVGTGFLMAGFLWMHHLTGSWTFAEWSLHGSDALWPALLVFVGLATKAGAWPFHLWLPIAHPAAPAPVSAIMSAVMIKTAIYAMMRLLVLGDIHVEQLAPVMLVIGAVSALWGVLFALLQNDLKKLLAYSSVENVGLIIMGMGVALTGRNSGSALYAVGLAAALLHTFNHALFKSLLFLGAGAVDASTHTRNLERLGGLVKSMPWTAACFLAACASICAIPPFNGFASEWMLYQSLFHVASTSTTVALRWQGLLMMGWLALVGALAMGCFVKAAGIMLLGTPRSREAAKAREVTWAMRAPLIILAASCLATGLSVPVLIQQLKPILATAKTSLPHTVAGLQLLPLAVVTGLALALVSVPFAVASRRSPARRFMTWECGFGSTGPRTQYSATSLVQPVARIFGFVYRYRLRVTREGRDRRHFPERVMVESSHEPYLETRIYRPLLTALERGAEHFLMRLQAGSIHQYLVYVAVALAIMLWVGLRAPASVSLPGNRSSVVADVARLSPSGTPKAVISPGTAKAVSP